MYARSNSQVPIQPVFVNHLGYPFKFYLHESIGESYAEVVRCITMEGGIIVCRHQQADCILVRPGLPGVRELGSSIPILRFDWVYACAHLRRTVFEGNWAGCFVDNSQHPITPTSYQVPAHHPSHPCPGPTSNTLPYYHSPTYAAPGPVLTQALSYPAPVYQIPNYVWFVHIIMDTVVPTHQEPIYNTPPTLGYAASGSSVPTHCAPPYHAPAYKGPGTATSTHNVPPGNTLATHAPISSTVSPQSLLLSSGHPFQPMCREQLEARSGANPQAVTGRTMPPSSNIHQVEPSSISRVVTIPLQAELPAALKLAIPAKSLATRSILPQVEAPGVSQVKRSSAYQDEFRSIESWPLASPQVDSQAILQIASVPTAQVHASSSAPLQLTTSIVSEVGSQVTSIIDSLSRSTSQTESFKRPRSPSATTSGAQSPTLSSISRATSPTVIQDQTLMSELGSSVGSDQDVRAKGLSLKRKREPSDLGQCTRDPKKPTLFKYWCQGCGLSFSQGGNAIEHKANPKSSNECRDSELVFAVNHPRSTKSSADPEQHTYASRVTCRSQRNRTPFEDRDLQRAMRNEDVLRWCNSIKQ